MLEVLSFETLQLETFVPLRHVPKKFQPLYPKHIPVIETADVANVDIVPSLFQPYAQSVLLFSFFNSFTYRYTLFITDQ